MGKGTELKDRVVLVTGGAGFIGSHLVETLVQSRVRVTVLDNLQAGSWANLATVQTAVERIEADVRDAAVLADAVSRVKPDVIFHLAANASVPGSARDPIYDFETNCVGTFRVLEAVRSQASGAKVVLASSGAVYGEPERFPIVEQSPLVPISPYGAGKLAAETECRVYQRVYGVNVSIARIFNTYGPRMPRFVVLDLLKKLDGNSDTLEILGTGRQVRDFTYVEDTVAGLLRIATHGAPGEAYNVASGKSHTVTELAELVLRIRGLEKRTKLVFTGESWPGDAQRWEVNIDKILRLGFRSRVALEEGLSRVFDWYRVSHY